jgi:hypothetical protein
MPILGVVPVKAMLKMFFFSKDFGDKMAFPLIALFLGTGNQTSKVSCAILERSSDANMKLWDSDPDTFLPNLPTIVAFSNLQKAIQNQIRPPAMRRPQVQGARRSNRLLERRGQRLSAYILYEVVRAGSAED